MRTQEEIIERMKQITVNGSDIFGAEMGDLADYLSFEVAKAAGLLKDDATAWPAPLTGVEAEKEVKVRIVEYLAFAWEKATRHRGLSAVRSIAHFRAWLWLLGDEELLDFTDNGDNYAPYGTPMLLRISEKYGFTAVPKEGRVMATEGACGPYCEDGCRLAGNDESAGCSRSS